MNYTNFQLRVNEKAVDDRMLHAIISGMNERREFSPHPKGKPEPKYGVTRDQLRAVRTVMRTFVEMDKEDGVSHLETCHCPACDKRRPILGAIDYQGTTVCNPCAIKFESSRVLKRVVGIGEFVSQERERRTTPKNISD